MPGATLQSDVWINEYISPHDVYQHGVVQLLAQRRTPFQEMYVIDSGTYGKALILDGKWQTCTGDEFLYHEPLIHVPFVCHGKPRKVLIAGGADGGALREALKWKSVEQVVVCDIDGDVIQACRDLLPEIHQGAFDDPRAKIVVGDAFEYLAQTESQWDVIIADLTDPIEEGPAYNLFTQEFFALVNRSLAPQGVFLNQAGSLAPPLAGILARVANTIGSVFSSVRIVQASVPTYGSPWGLALASQQDLSERCQLEWVNEVLHRNLVAPCRSFDSDEFMRLMHSPKYIRDLIEQETVIYRKDSPPRFFGRDRRD